MPELIDSQSALPSRRAVIGAAVWSVPVIALVTATPAFAASPSTGFDALSPSISRLRALGGGKRISVDVKLAYASASSTDPSTVLFTWVLTVSGPPGTQTVKSGSGNVAKAGTWTQKNIPYTAGGKLTAGTYTFTFTVTVAGSGSKSSSSKITI